MGLLGNIGGIEARRSIHVNGNADASEVGRAVSEVDRKLEYSSITTRIVIERIEAQLRKFNAVTNNITGPAGPAGPPGPPGPPGTGGTVLPAIAEMPYPFVVTPSFVFPPDGSALFGPAQAFRITWAEIHCDPEFTAATANTTFTIQNAPSGPSSTGSVTIASGTRRGEANMNVIFAAGQRLYIVAPATLNGVQNLWSLRFRGDLP